MISHFLPLSLSLDRLTLKQRYFAEGVLKFEDNLNYWLMKCEEKTKKEKSKCLLINCKTEKKEKKHK